jgi:hypothetical protein
MARFRFISILVFLGVFSLASSVHAGFLGDWLGIDDTNKILKEELEGYRKTLSSIAYDSVPGAWWNKLVRDLNQGNPDEKKAAQDFLKNIAAIDTVNQYEGRIHLGFSGSDNIEYDFFFAATPSSAEVDKYLLNKSYTDKFARSSLQVPMSFEQLKAKISEDLVAAWLGSNRFDLNDACGGEATCERTRLLVFGACRPDRNDIECIKSFKQQLQRPAKAITEAILRTYP